MHWANMSIVEMPERFWRPSASTGAAKHKIIIGSDLPHFEMFCGPGLVAPLIGAQPRIYVA